MSKLHGTGSVEKPVEQKQARPLAVPRGWIIVGCIVISWLVLIGASNALSKLLHFFSA